MPGVLRSSGKVEVYFVDYGNTDTIEQSDLRYMKAEFAQMETQAIKCSLEGIDDVSKAWSDGDIERFTALTEDTVKVQYHAHIR